MPHEVLHWLDARPGQVLVDGTLGGGGHTRLLAEAVGGRESGWSSGFSLPHSLKAELQQRRVIALDRDPAALARAEVSLAGLPVTLVQSNFRDLPEVLRQLEVDAVDGVLLDLGLSSDQLADESRGFSFSSEGPLDLRFDPHEGEPAARLVNRLSERHLADLIFHYGEERYSRRIAAAIVEDRRRRPIETAAHLAQLVRRAVPGSPRSRGERIDPATRTFQALRIAVNDELRSLEIALRRIPDCLREGGRLVVISFHSLEDRRVKEAFRSDARLEVLTRRPVLPSDEEVAANPRARSAKLRAARKVG
jgi:16S rRNA (cytosine1402-N4)-methyltransferase